MRKCCRGWPAKVVAALVALTAAPSAAQTDAQTDAGATAPWFEPEATEFYGSVAFEGTLFAEDPAFEGQERDDVSVAVEPTFLAEWRRGDVALTVTPFLRYDQADDRRTHFDLREAKIDVREGPWELTVGADFVFWGRTEAQRLVDVINTVDGVEGIDEEEKLGQPMVRLTRQTEIGAFTGFYMPYFRERTFRGVGGRLRPELRVNEGDRIFNTSAGVWTPSFALAWEHFFDAFDVRAHGFHGVSRDPAFAVFSTDGLGRPTALVPVYDEISQVGFDGQYTSDATLWKLETLYRTGQRDRDFEKTDYWAATGGIEYTFFGIAESNADLGVIVEGSYDTRGDDATTTFNNDAIAGLRLALNDTQDTSFLITGATDVVSGSTSMRIEAERRIVGGWKAEVEAQAFLQTDSDDLEADFEDDSFLRITLSYFW